MLIGISGKIGSGKDVTATLLKSCLYNNIVEIHRFADTLKDIVCLLLNCGREQLEDRQFKETELGEEWQKGDTRLSPRLLLQLIGTNCGRDIIHPNIWVNSLFSKYKEDSNWIIPDVRFKNEAEEVKKHNGILIRIDRNYRTIKEWNTLFPTISVKEDANNLISIEKYIDKIYPHKLNESKKIIDKTFSMSETALDNYAGFDYYIDNNSTISNLVNSVSEITKKICKNGKM